MEPFVRWSRPLAGLGLVLSMTILAACNGAGAGPSVGTGAAASGPPEPSAAPASTTPGAAAASPITMASLDILPAVSFDPKKVKVACDDATMGTSASMSCDDIAAASVRVATVITKSPVTQISVTKPADNPNGIQVTFWAQAEDATGLTAFTATIDPANGTFTFPKEDPEAVFPTTS